MSYDNVCIITEEPPPIAVLTFEHQNRWFVHGITIDYCASAATKDEAMIRFWSSLCLVFYGAHLQHGSIESVIKPPSAETLAHLERIAGRPIARPAPSTKTVQ